MVESVDIFKPLIIGVGTVVYKEETEGEILVLLGKRATNPKNKWAIPGGIQDDYVGNPELPEELRDKSVIETAIREIFEETGISVNRNSLRIVSVDDSDIEKTHHLNFGFAIQVSPNIEPNLSTASHQHEFHEWKWFLLTQRDSKLSLQDAEGRTVVEENDIFYPCITTLKRFYIRYNSFNANR